MRTITDGLATWGCFFCTVIRLDYLVQCTTCNALLYCMLAVMLHLTLFSLSLLRTDV